MDGYRFEREIPWRVDGEEAKSTRRCLEKVEYSPEHDLRGRRVYRPEALARAWVVKVEELGRTVLQVFAGEDRDSPHESVAVISRRGPLGRVRPTQRYVLAAGISRVSELTDRMLPHCTEPWGCLEIASATSDELVTLTPPILERLHDLDVVTTPDVPDFIVCDGNHRIVERAWRRGQPVAVVASLLAPDEPYYTVPTPGYDWEPVSLNEVATAPSHENRYTIREPGYRRYFRSLEVGFGCIGSQGGR